MPCETLAFADFLKQFAGDIRYDAGGNRTLYSIVIGAGGSRSAGVPTAPEMVAALRRIARARRVSLTGKPRGESHLSWCIRRLWGSRGRRSADDGYVRSVREFLLACLHRASKEANVTHLIAAHLATAGIVNPIVTTNFDDLALAAFWDLPWTSADDEPHVIYDPEGAVRSNPRIAEGVPIILKAHGHHTSYAMRYLDRQIERAAPYVRRLLATLPSPLHGYIVVGYSGEWNDGVMDAFANRELMVGKSIYWFHRGNMEPQNKLIEQVSRNARIVFVRISDADLAFVQLWAAIPEDDGDGEDLASAFSIGRTFWGDHLFSYPRSWRADDRIWPLTGQDWFDGTLIHANGEWRPANPAQLDELRKDLLPILDRIDAVDRKWLGDDCISAGNRRLPRKLREETAAIEEFEMKALRDRVPVNLEWTRRNRALLRMALSDKTELQLGTYLLSVLSSMSAHS